MLCFAYVFISDHNTIRNCHYLLSFYKIKTYWRTNKIKTENNELKNVSVKNRTCYYFDDIIKIEDFGFDNILLDEESTKIF